MYDGVSVICDNITKRCKTLSGFCELGQIGTNDTTILGDVRNSVGADRQKYQSYFRYAMNEFPLDWEYRIAHAFECLHRSPDTSVTPSGSTTGSGPGDGGGRKTVP
jgi:hypothetical protein